MKPRARSLLLLIALLAGVPALSAQTTAPATQPMALPVLQCKTYSVGNSFTRHVAAVQPDIQSIHVRPDGTVLTNSPWDPNGREAGMYRDGRAVGQLVDTHGWGRSGALAVACNEDWIYATLWQAGGYEGPKPNIMGGMKYPRPRGTWQVLRRYSLTGEPGAFPTGNGWDGSMMVLHEQFDRKPDDIRMPSMVAAKMRVYLADPALDKVRVFDVNSLTSIQEFALERPGALTMGPRGIWAVQEASNTEPARVVFMRGLDKDALGAPTITLPAQCKPVALVYTEAPILPNAPEALMPTSPETPVPAKVTPRKMFSEGTRMLVVDAGPDQNLKIYKNLDTYPVLEKTIGLKGGVAAAKVPGTTGPLIFTNPTGAGFDKAGNLYVSQSASTMGGGAVLECYSPKLERLWTLHGLIQQEAADFDPAEDGLVLQGPEDRFTLADMTGAAPAWSWSAFTTSPTQFPHDMRVNIAMGGGSTWLRRINGQPIMYVTDPQGRPLAIYRFDAKKYGTTAIPSGYIATRGRGTATWPPERPAGFNDFIWCDDNGDGRMQAQEYLAARYPAPAVDSMAVDRDGNVWMAGRVLLKYACGGLDAQGNPIYDFAKVESFPLPAPLNRVGRVEYDAASDTLVLTGYTAQLPADDPDLAGRVIMAIPRFNAGNREPAWVTELPYRQHPRDYNELDLPKSLTVAGGYYFLGMLGGRRGIVVGDVATGKLVGELKPGVDMDVSDVDQMFGLRALARKDGSIVISQTDRIGGKIVVYHWQPPTAGK
jgi:hypothetical protein